MQGIYQYMYLRKILFLLLISFASPAQLLRDAWAKQSIQAGLNAMYNFDFKEAQQQFNLIKSKYPAHPAGYLLQGMMLEWQYFPLSEHPQQNKAYVQWMEKSYALAEKSYEKNESDIEAAFFCSASLGFLAAGEANNNNFLKAVSYAKRAYHFLKIGIEKVDEQPEFLYAAGIYHYYRIVYPELHPMIKPFMWFFMDGDKKLGLQQLDKAGKQAVFVRNEALFYLPYVYNKYEGNPALGLSINKQLCEDYPNNPIYNLQRAELLVLSKQYEEAVPYLDKLAKSKNRYLEGSFHTLEGMRHEAKKDWKSAEQHYLRSTHLPFEEKFTKDIRGLSYLGLARIALRNGQKQTAKKYVHLAENYVEYRNSKEELKRLQNGK